MTDLPEGWAECPLSEVCEILDHRRIPINAKERSQRIAGKHVDALFPYFGATGQVGFIDDYRFEGEHVLIGEDGGLCCTNHVGESSRESSVVAGSHEQTDNPDLQDQELAGL